MNNMFPRRAILWDRKNQGRWLKDYEDPREKTEIRVEPPKEFSCNCKKPRCISFFCGCRRWGFRCNANCACSASAACKNPLRHLPLLFGDDDDADDGEKLRPSGCFARYIAKQARSNPENIDFEDLRCTLMGAQDSSYFKLPEDPVFDSEEADYLDEWKITWLQGFTSSAEKKAHVQALFRYGLGNDGLTCDEKPERREISDYGEPRDEKRWFYSFCRNTWKQRGQVWHCRDCEQCRGANTWHCNKCQKCRRGLNVPCKGCYGVSSRPDDEEYEAEDDQMDDDKNDEKDDGENDDEAD